MLTLEQRIYIVRSYGLGHGKSYMAVLRQFHETWPDVPLSDVGIRKIVMKFMRTDSVVNRKREKKNYDEDDAVAVMTMNSVRTFPKLSLRQRSAQIGNTLYVVLAVATVANCGFLNGDLHGDLSPPSAGLQFSTGYGDNAPNIPLGVNLQPAIESHGQYSAESYSSSASLNSGFEGHYADSHSASVPSVIEGPALGGGYASSSGYATNGGYASSSGYASSGGYATNGGLTSIGGYAQSNGLESTGGYALGGGFAPSVGFASSGGIATSSGFGGSGGIASNIGPIASGPISTGNAFIGGASLGASGSGDLQNHGPLNDAGTTYDHRYERVPVPQPVPVQVTVNRPYPVAVPVPRPVDVPRPVRVEVPTPVRVEVRRPVPVQVPRQVPYPVKTPVYHKVLTPVHVKVPKPYPVVIAKPYPVHVPVNVAVKIPVPVGVHSTGPVGVHAQGGYITLRNQGHGGWSSGGGW